MASGDIVLLGIESSCDETSAAVLKNGKILANIVAGQAVHEAFGGVVPELASRAHQANIVPVVDTALKKAGISKKDLSAIAYTRGPGLMGSLLVGSSFAKASALCLGIPLIEVNHMQAHILSHFIDNKPSFPFLCLTVSGGHTQIVRVNDFLEQEILGETKDDAVGEAFDKGAKLMGLPYPGGPYIDKHAQKGKPDKFSFPVPRISGFDFSFSGIKTSLLYLINEHTRKDASFIADNLDDLCASYQYSLIRILMEKLEAASDETGIKEIAIAGGVAANSGIRTALKDLAARKHWKTYIPAFEYCTDNAAMIAITGYYKFLKHEISSQDQPTLARYAL